MRRALFLALRNTGFSYLRHPAGRQNHAIPALQPLQEPYSYQAAGGEEEADAGPDGQRLRAESGSLAPGEKGPADPVTSDIKDFFSMCRDDDNKPNQWLQSPASQAMRSRSCPLPSTMATASSSDLLSCLTEEVNLESDVLHSREREEPFSWPARNLLLYAPTLPAKSNETRSERCGPHRQRLSDAALQLFISHPSTAHRVVEPPQVAQSSAADVPDRYSIAFIDHFNLEEMVQPLTTVFPEEHPP
ncbi:MAG: hypothetical protein M1818_004930 [Claussenomyces sp. TS43310]|nr:MAG: hypothetical protein M1818_004930 [Claussenomyces sp. TS43310]